jgi:hypothetical protein
VHMTASVTRHAVPYPWQVYFGLCMRPCEALHKNSISGKLIVSFNNSIRSSSIRNCGTRCSRLQQQTCR